MPALSATLRARYGVASLIIIGAGLLATVSGASALTALQQPDGPHRRHARTARSTYIRESANLHLVAHQGTQILHEEGQVSGTLHGRLTAVINIAYTQATVTFTAHPGGGTFTGRGVESYYVSGKTGHFSGRMTVTGGTGAYARASSSGLETTGLIKRAHYEVLMTVVGRLRS